ncbi:hypothetical protein QBC41DRAFT_23493 [Cercophora samala]|uniref:Uncharacterized protein n=1 Tax=Cercophora samala TaxID=330535 RepID=A0AA39Z565_9PEZI|nr:hypothetical protein QBC41DRAFT_23493 [Cercophora samala]
MGRQPGWSRPYDGEMPRHIDQDVHSAFVEFRNGNEPKCMSVQCLFCQQIRAKNTTRQKQHLLQCAPYLAAHPEVALQASTAAEEAAAAGSSSEPPHGHSDASPYPNPNAASGDHTNLGFMPNPRINGTPSQPPGHGGRPSIGAPDGTPAAKRQKTKNSNLPEIPLREVHAAFAEFKAKEDDKCMSARCLYCHQVRAKNTSRQREHLMVCPDYQSVLKEKIPANNLRHQFDEDDVASSLALPTPSLTLDFRMSIRVKPKLSIGAANFGRESWISCIGGQWAGRFGKGILLPGGQDKQTTVKDMATRIDANYLLQTNDEQPALITCKVKGWWTGDRDVMERLQDPVAADNVAAHRYLFRVVIELETGDERYADVNTGLWVGSGCRRGAEIVYDAHRVS